MTVSPHTILQHNLLCTLIDTWYRVEKCRSLSCKPSSEVEGGRPAACTAGQLFQHVGLCGCVSQINPILQPLIPPARHVLAISAQRDFLKKIKRIGYFKMERCRGRTLKESCAFCVFRATGAELAARTILQVPTHSKESRHRVLCCSQIAATCSSLLEKKQHGKS